MALIVKRRARKLIAKSEITAAIYPNGIGGIDGNQMCVGLEVGDMRLIMSDYEWKQTIDCVQRLKDNI